MEIDMDTFSKEEIIEALIQNTPIAYIVLDDEYRIHFLNDSFLRLRELSKDDTLGEICYNISNKGIPCNKCAVRVALETGKKEMVSRKDILPDGVVRYIDDYAIPLTVNGENKRRYVLEIMDNRTATMKARAQRQIALNEILESLIELLESKDEYTARHSRNVHRYAMMIAEKMGLDDHMTNEIGVAGLLHDIGKVEVPYEIINKPSHLDEEEYAIIKTHPGNGDEMLDGLSQFMGIRTHVRHHHERIDGKGYPDGLGAEDLTLGAKILAVADTYDAMTTDRAYRKALSHLEALEELVRVSGSQLDPEVVAYFLEVDLNGESMEEGKVDEKEYVRTLETPSVKTENLDEVRKRLDYRSDVDEGEFLQAIFDNTPCGYVLYDNNSRVIFASNYYIAYMGIDEDRFAGSVSDDPLIAQTIVSRKTIIQIKEEILCGQEKAYELYSIPVLNNESGEVDYVIGCIIDRTEEIQLQKSFENDFIRVIGLIKDLLQKRMGNNVYADEVVRLEKCLTDIVNKNRAIL